MQISSSAESGTAEELGILNFEFLLRQAAKPSGELFSASPAILNYSVYSRRGKLRRLWRLAVATHPRTTSRLSMSCGFRGAGPIS